MFGYRPPILQLVPDHQELGSSISIPSSFDSIGQAKFYLDRIMSGILRLRGDLVLLAEQAALQSECFPADSHQRLCYIEALSRSVALGSEHDRIVFLQRVLAQASVVFGEA